MRQPTLNAKQKDEAGVQRVIERLAKRFEKELQKYRRRILPKIKRLATPENYKSACAELDAADAALARGDLHSAQERYSASRQAGLAFLSDRRK